MSPSRKASEREFPLLVLFLDIKKMMTMGTVLREKMMKMGTILRVRIATVNVFDPATDLIRPLKNNFNSKELKSYRTAATTGFDHAEGSHQVA